MPKWNSVCPTLHTCVIFLLNETLVNKKMSCCWNVTWLDIYLATLILLGACYLLVYVTKINLFISIPHPNQVYDKKKKHFWVVICVCCMLCSEIVFFPGWRFPTGSTKKIFLGGQPWWWPLVNTSLISQFRENVSSFNFLANTLKRAD